MQDAVLSIHKSLGHQTRRSNVVRLTDFFTNQLAETKISTSSTALIENSTHSQITFKELESKSAQLAAVISSLILNNNSNHEIPNRNPDGDIVIGVCMEPSIELIIALFAILKCGAAYVPIGIGIPENRVKHILQDCRPIAVICSTDVTSNFDPFSKSSDIQIWPISYLLSLVGPKLVGSADLLTPDQEIALILYTSGSTGIPKGVRVTHRSIMNRLEWQWDEFPYGTVEKCCMKTSITFGDSIAEIFGPLLQGIPLVIFDSRVTSQTNILIESLATHSITRIVLVPSLLRNILKTLEFLEDSKENEPSYKIPTRTSPLQHLSLWICSGEALEADLLRAFFDKFNDNAVLCNFYGSTEVTFDVTYVVFRNSSDVKQKLGFKNTVPIGKCLRNSETYILDEELTHVKNGEVGELCIGGMVVASGYVGIQESDKFVYVQNGGPQRVFRTGDLVQLTSSINGDLNLFYVGRKDSQIKVRGHRVDLNEISAALKKIPEIENSVVLCYKPGTEEQNILAFVVAQKKVTISNMKKSLQMYLEKYQLPTLIPVTNIPLLINGKTDRQYLLTIYENNMQLGTEPDWNPLPEPIRDSTHCRAIIQCISDVLHVSINEIISNIHESFYVIGGTSLNTISVISKLWEQGILISIPEFTKANSISEIVLLSNRVHKDTEKVPCICKCPLSNTPSEYTVEQLLPEHKVELFSLICYGEANKGDLEILVDTKESDVEEWLKADYDFHVDTGLSFVVKRTETGEIIASALNKGLTDVAPPFIPVKNHGYVFEILEYIDASQVSNLPYPHEKVFRSGPINTRKNVEQDENVRLIKFVEEQNIRVARQHGFYGIQSTNLNFLTQQLTRDLMGYKVLLDYQVNQFVSKDGNQPFKAAPDNQRAICCFKFLT